MRKRLSFAAFALLVVALVVVGEGFRRLITSTQPPSDGETTVSAQTLPRFTVKATSIAAGTQVRLVADSLTGKCYAVIELAGNGLTSLGEVPCDPKPPAENP